MYEIRCIDRYCLGLKLPRKLKNEEILTLNVIDMYIKIK